MGRTSGELKGRWDSVGLEDPKDVSEAVELRERTVDRTAVFERGCCGEGGEERMVEGLERGVDEWTPSCEVLVGGNDGAVGRKSVPCWELSLSFCESIFLPARLPRFPIPATLPASTPSPAGSSVLRHHTHTQRLQHVIPPLLVTRYGLRRTRSGAKILGRMQSCKNGSFSLSLSRVLGRDSRGLHS